VSLVTILSGCEINNFAGQSVKSVCYNLVAMFDLFRLWLGAVLLLFRTRRSLMLENLDRANSTAFIDLPVSPT
jgi:hypothetical protein